MASVLIHSLLKATTEWLSLIRSTPPTSPATTTTTVADDLEKLERLLPRIKAALLDAEKREIVDDSVKLWLKEIKDVAYDAEDVLDEYHYHVLRAQVENRDIASPAAASMKMKGVEGEEEVMPSASSDSNPAAKISVLNSLADKIKSIRRRFKEISNDRHNLHLKPEDGERGGGSRSEHPPATSHMIVKQEICGRDDDKAKLIDWLFSNMESKFEVLAVIGKGGLGKTTLAQLVYNDQKILNYFKTRMWICVSEDFDVTRLTRAMVESITRKNPCTSSDQLSLLQESLHEELQGRRVLLVLDDVWDDKKEFFKASWESLRTPLKENGAEMVRIIVTTRIASVAEIMQTRKNPYRLGHMPEDQCWELFKRHAFCGRDPEEFPSLLAIGKRIVKKCDGLPLSVKSFGGLLQHERDEDGWKDVLQSRLWELDTEILPALKLSYIRMPSHLKPCFEICSMFPKDYEFTKDELVSLWAANGYIQLQHDNNDAVEEKRYKYFKELHRRSFFDGDSSPYNMHDNIHDLAHYAQAGMDLLSKHKTRHLSIKKQSLEFNLLDDDIGELRSLMVGETDIETRLSNSRRGRKHASMLHDMLGRRIIRLTHLRYLSITHDWSEDESFLLESLRSTICLRHLALYTDGNLTLTKSIGHMHNLVVLEIYCNGLVELPESLGSLVSLTTVHFEGFNNRRLPALGQLPSLRSLALHRLEYVESIGSEFYRDHSSDNHHHHRVAFPSLTSLEFLGLTRWTKWGELQGGDFPRLQRLHLTYCYFLSSLPSLGNLSLLSHMCIKSCDKIHISAFPPNLKTLEILEDTELSLPQGFEELEKLESCLEGNYWIRPASKTGQLCIIGLGLTNVHDYLYLNRTKQVNKLCW